jgi:DNA-binding response OmpR family regulator
MVPVHHPISTATAVPAPELIAIKSRRTILLLDDDPASRKLLRRLLTREGYDVREAPDAGDVVEWRDAGVELAIVNLSVPEAAEKTIRALRDAYPDWIVLILSETPALEGRSENLVILPKPSRALAVVESVRELMSRDGQPGGDARAGVLQE